MAVNVYTRPKKTAHRSGRQRGNFRKIRVHIGIHISAISFLSRGLKIPGYTIQGGRYSKCFTRYRFNPLHDSNRRFLNGGMGKRNMSRRHGRADPAPHQTTPRSRRNRTLMAAYRRRCSRPVSVSKSASNCGQYPMSRWIASGSLPTSCPPSDAVPPEAGIPPVAWLIRRMAHNASIRFFNNEEACMYCTVRGQEEARETYHHLVQDHMLMYGIGYQPRCIVRCVYNPIHGCDTIRGDAILTSWP